MVKYFKSLKFKILFYCFSFATVILTIVISVCFFTFNNLLKLNNVQTINHNLKIALDNIDNNVTSIANLANWASVSTTISTFASANTKYSKDFRTKTLSAYTALKNQSYSLGIDHYIDKLIVYSNNGSSIQFGSIYGNPTDIKVASSAPYFNTLINSPNIKWVGIYKEHFAESKDGNKIIPIVKNIESGARKPLGWIYISVNTNVITDFLTIYDFDKGSKLYLMIGGHVYDVSDRQNLVKTNFPFYGSDLQYKNYKAIKYVDFVKDGTKSTAVYYTSPKTGWTLIQTLSNYQFAFQNKVYAYLLYFLAGGIILLTILIYFTVSTTVSRPILKISQHIERISSGDFSHNPDIESENEIGHIGIGINKMSSDIKKLITVRIEDEKTRKNLELKMLQNQINPHFLYNTLNSIKWMATIQKATGISEIVSSLAVLLKNIAKGTDELITLEQEIKLLDEYCTIQKYRSGGLFNIHYYFGDQQYKKCKIIKFTLQPIVENSIFHGIEPKGGGNIDIHIMRPSENILQICIKDDGVGMNEEQIQSLMKGTNEKGKKFNNIGIKNVDERLKLTFGELYGVNVDSKPGEYTNVSITLPYTLPDDNENSNQ